MIDVHCHLEQKDYDKDREQVIGQCKQELKALVTCSAHPEDLEKTLKIAKKHPRFIFCTIGLHPEFIKELSQKDIDDSIKAMEQNKNSIAAIGEVGLDYHWIKEEEWREKQKILFQKMIQLAKKLNLPLVIHSWDSTGDVIEILEQQGMKNKKVLMHQFSDKRTLQRIIDNGWFISIGPGIAKSKDIKKVARDAPLNRIMLETDSPWFGQEGQKRGTPTNVKVAAEKIAEAKKIPVEEVEKQTDLNAIAFFGLDIK